MTFPPLQRANERAGSRAQVPRSNAAVTIAGGWWSHPGRARRQTQARNLTLPMHARFQKTLKRQGCFLAVQGGIVIPPTCFTCSLRATLGPPPCTLSVNPAQRRWQPGDWLPSHPSSETGPGSPRKQHWFGHFQGFMFASNMLERWPCREMNSGAQTLSHVFPSKPMS